MIYKILTRRQDGHFQYYKEANADWVTTSDTAAKEKMLSLLNSYKLSDFQLITHINVSLDISRPPATLVPVLNTPMLNDGDVFKCAIAFDSRYVIIELNQDAVQDLIDSLEDAGLTDISVDTGRGILATNPSGMPIVASFTLPSGFARLYDKQTGSDNFISDLQAVSTEANNPEYTLR